MTEGGLYTNGEASVALWLNLHDPSEFALLNQIKADFNNWRDEKNGNATQLTQEYLQLLADAGLVLPETKITIKVSAIFGIIDIKILRASKRGVIYIIPIIGTFFCS